MWTFQRGKNVVAVHIHAPAGLQTQQIVVQNSSVVSASTPVAPTTSSPPPPTPPPSESTTQSPPSESPSESVVIFSSPPPASTPAATTPASQPSPGSATGCPLCSANNLHIPLSRAPLSANSQKLVGLELYVECLSRHSQATPILLPLVQAQNPNSFYRDVDKQHDDGRRCQLMQTVGILHTDSRYFAYFSGPCGLEGLRYSIDGCASECSMGLVGARDLTAVPDLFRYWKQWDGSLIAELGWWDLSRGNCWNRSRGGRSPGCCRFVVFLHLCGTLLRISTIVAVCPFSLSKFLNFSAIPAPLKKRFPTLML